MLIAEELLLIGLDPTKGSLPIRTSEYLEIGLSGALFAELVLLVAAEIRDGTVVAVPGEAPADPVLAAAQAFLADEAEGFVSEDALRRLDKALDGVRKQLSTRLVEAGVLRVVEGGRLSSTKYPAVDVALHADVLGSAQAAARGDEPLTDREAILLAMAGPSRLLERVAPAPSDHKHAKARIAEASGQAPFAREVEKIIDKLVAAESGL